ncbi:hypothetical protein GOQ27_06980 [Clostridium sp. D2Q-11]|uniref:Uncharacterized protein n=1 Tax=Anaeromonas frigoriresistens TaxID=2683708 RepID=A0A942UUF0_9FIRM|nr:hypothetical protein [Anaeromonas frigoriresistens]MBS4538200.1 hypothetical protein [Anaeromonas frigoriresistens]
MIAELIPYKSFKEKIKIVREEQKKNRYIEIWENSIYSATKFSEMGVEDEEYKGQIL